MEVETSSGEVTVEAEESGAEPGESWIGSPPSSEGANRHLDRARQAAEDGDEATCAEHAAQAARILDALEG